MNDERYKALEQRIEEIEEQIANDNFGDIEERVYEIEGQIERYKHNSNLLTYKSVYCCIIVDTLQNFEQIICKNKKGNMRDCRMTSWE